MLNLSLAFLTCFMPPFSYFCDSPKKMNGKSCQFFLTFYKYVNERLGTTFCSQITFSVVRRGLKWSTFPLFHKGGPWQEQQEGKITNQNRCQVIHTCCTQLFGYFSVETSWSRRDM